MPVNVEVAPFGDAGASHPAVLRSPRPDPEVRRLLRQLNAWPARWTRYELEAGRRDWQLTVKAFGSREPVRSVEERTIRTRSGSIRLRIYTPESGSRPRALLAWFHGGGFIVGDLYTSGATCRALANRTGAIVVAVGYRLAPEHPLHAGIEDCLAAVRWLSEHADELGGDPEAIAVGGDSAGGLLAASVALACARPGEPRLSAQVLVYPATELLSDFPSNRENADGYLLTRERLAWIRSEIARSTDLTDSRLSPLHAPDLRGVAPAIVVSAGYDPIRDEGLAYADRLRAAGVPVHGLHYPGQIHGFVNFDRVLVGARDALRRIGCALPVAYASPEAPLRGEDPPSLPDSAYEHLSWLHPRQRWNELLVAGLALQEQVRRRSRRRAD